MTARELIENLQYAHSEQTVYVRYNGKFLEVDAVRIINLVDIEKDTNEDIILIDFTWST